MTSHIRTVDGYAAIASRTREAVIVWIRGEADDTTDLSRMAAHAADALDAAVAELRAIRDTQREETA